jgi:capsular polysaccharide export protein
LDQPRDAGEYGDAPTLKAAAEALLQHVIASHPGAGLILLSSQRPGLLAQNLQTSALCLDAIALPWSFYDEARAIYTVSSELGFTALLAGQPLHVFAPTWYAGWGLTQDHRFQTKRDRQLSTNQLAAIALIEAPQSDAPIPTLEQCLGQIEAQRRASHEDAQGYIATGMASWKRRHLRRYFGAKSIQFQPQHTASLGNANNAPKHMAWGAAPQADIRIEDGFLRSRGLGAALIAPLSLICDDLGIYFDPNRPSRMEYHIACRAQMPEHARLRICALTQRLTDARLSKYNVGKTLPALPKGYKILVVGQVEDDASIQLGTQDIYTNHALLLAAKEAHPNAILVYKPHPDVEAGLRIGDTASSADLADVIAYDTDPIALIEACDEVWTMTSLLGFEALLHGVPVTCAGMPFYAGWGLTTDLSTAPERRKARPTLMGLAHAALIDAPRYFEPKTGTPLSPEQAIELLERSDLGRSKLMQKTLAYLYRLKNTLRRNQP